MGWGERGRGGGGRPGELGRELRGTFFSVAACVVPSARIREMAGDG